jgi:DHA3 family macrolide efflux protein-like MFS transporter
VLPALVGLGAGVVALGLAPAYAPAVAAILVIGLLAPIANGPIQAILQATIAADYQGRVFTLMGSIAGATAPLGLLLAAPVAEMVGVRSWYLAGGLACSALGIAGFLLPSLMRIEEPSEPGAVDAANAGARSDVESSARYARA